MEEDSEGEDDLWGCNLDFDGDGDGLQQAQEQEEQPALGLVLVEREQGQEHEQEQDQEQRQDDALAVEEDDCGDEQHQQLAETFTDAALDIGEPDSERVILHVDLDAFYAQVEQNRHPELKGLPVAVQQWQSLIAVSYEARAAGVTRFMTAKVAKSQCPDLHLVHVDIQNEKVSLEAYREASRRILAVIHRFGTCEKASVDEAYVDVTSLVAQLMDRLACDDALLSPADCAAVLLRLCSVMGAVDSTAAHLGPEARSRLATAAAATATATATMTATARDGERAHHHPEAAAAQQGEQGLDTASEARPAFPESPLGFRFDAYTSAADGVAAALALTHVIGQEGGLLHRAWRPTERHDTALLFGAMVAACVRRAVELETGYFCSAGIAHNKLLAKIGSGSHKPAQQTLLPAAAVQAFLLPRPVKSVPLLGGKLGDMLEVAFGSGETVVRNGRRKSDHSLSVAECLSLTRAQLAAAVGHETAAWLHSYLRGRDSRGVEVKGPPRSLLEAKSMTSPLADMDGVRYWLSNLAASLATRIVADAARHRRWPKTLVLQCADRNYASISRSVGVPALAALARTTSWQLTAEGEQDLSARITETCMEAVRRYFAPPVVPELFLRRISLFAQFPLTAPADTAMQNSLRRFLARTPTATGASAGASSKNVGACAAAGPGGPTPQKKSISSSPLFKAFHSSSASSSSSISSSSKATSVGLAGRAELPQTVESHFNASSPQVSSSDDVVSISRTSGAPECVSPDVECPVCAALVPASDADRHVNAHFDAPPSASSRASGSGTADSQHSITSPWAGVRRHHGDGGAMAAGGTGGGGKAARSRTSGNNNSSSSSSSSKNNNHNSCDKAGRSTLDRFFSGAK